MTSDKALYWFNCRYSPNIYDNDENEAYGCAIEALKEQRPKGHWISDVKPFGNDTTQCDMCGFFINADCNYNYCPNCGARMIEPQESEET